MDTVDRLRDASRRAVVWFYAAWLYTCRAFYEMWDGLSGRALQRRSSDLYAQMVIWRLRARVAERALEAVHTRTTLPPPSLDWDSDGPVTERIEAPYGYAPPHPEVLACEEIGSLVRKGK